METTTFNPLTEFVSSYGDVVELDFDVVNLDAYRDLILNHPEWKQYNTYKQGYNRYGLSMTSLDGGYSGVPDLESLVEYYKETKEIYYDRDFKVRTPLSYEIPEVSKLFDFFGEDLSRSHFLRLDKGGFFPPHRDHNFTLPNNMCRIIIPFYNFHSSKMTWVFDGKVLQLTEGVTYFMNTNKAHSLFSYVDGCTMLVLNVSATEDTMNRLVRKMRVY
jgi:hypothetical protein